MKGGETGAELPTYNIYTLEISDPPAVYHLNHFNSGSSIRITYTGEPLDIEVAGNATLSLKALSIDGRQIAPSQNLRAEVTLFDGIQIWGMNPAHILRRLYTDPSIGRGLGALRLDEESWRQAADTFFAEGMGLCLKWSRSGSVANFAGEVINHAGAAVYTSRRTGKIVLQPIRGDYDIEDLPLYTPDTGLLGFDDDVSSAQQSGINEVVVKYFDPIKKSEAAVREKNLGAILAAGSITVAEEVSYPGIATESLARRVARRDLKAKSGFIKRMSVRLDRRGSRIMPGHVFRVSDPSRGIVNMVLRAGRVEYGTVTDGTVTVVALEDIFGLPATVYREPEENGYVPPDNSPRIPSLQRVIEAPYRELVQALGQAEAGSMDPSSGYLHGIAVRPSALTESFTMVAQVSPEEYRAVADGGAFCPGGELSADLGLLDKEITLINAVGLESASPGMAALIGEEIVRIESVDTVHGSMTIARGCVDTVPLAHTAGTPVFCYDSWGADDKTEYIAGVSVNAKLLTRTSIGTLSQLVAPQQQLLFAARAARPYPPGQFKVNGVSYPDVVHGDIVVSWAHRDRLTQSDRLIDSDQASIGPEAGVTYDLAFYTDQSPTPIASESGITSDSLTWSPPGDDLYRIELWSSKGELKSWQIHSHLVQRGTSLPWSPADLQTQPSIWLDDESTLAEANARASSWSNSRGSLGGSFTQSSTSNQPSVILLNGRRALSFDGDGDSLQGSTETRQLGTGKSKTWVFAVYKKRSADSSDQNRPVLVALSDSGGYRLSLAAGGNQTNARNKPSTGGRRLLGDSYNGVNATSTAQGAWLQSIGLFDFAARTIRLYVNGGLDKELLNAWGGSGNSDATLHGSVTIAREGSFAVSSDIDVAAIFAGSSELSEKKKKKLEGWAAHRYGLTESLAASHPYKQTPPTKQ